MDEAAEEIAYCADVLGSCEHEDCAKAMSRELWADMALTWTCADARWLRKMCRSIMRRSWRRLRAWVQRGL